MTERERMEKIKSEWGAFILRAVAGTPVPEALVAALVANESGGADGSKRFEPEVYGHLVRVQVGMETYYGSLKRADLRNLSDEALRGLATSWGPNPDYGI